MAENAFLTAVDTYLESVGLSPTPLSVGPVEPSTDADLPAVVLSLENSKRPGNGLGERAAVMTGALAWQATINLVSPLLGGSPPLNLLSTDRLVLTLPHGGLVRATGLGGALTAADISVTVGGAPRTLMAAPATGTNYSVDPLVGQLTFGTALPATGPVVVSYFIGQWERRVVKLVGGLRIDVLAEATADVITLSDDALNAMLADDARTQIQGLVAIGATHVGSIGLKEQESSKGRRRTLRFDFIYEHLIDRPDSSGGIIHTVPVDTTIGLPD